MTSRLNVMISSTARDLPDHRKQVIAACERMGFFPLPMENLPAAPGDAVRVSLDLVDQADLYVGIFAHRYGYVARPGFRSRARPRPQDCELPDDRPEHQSTAAERESGCGSHAGAPHRPQARPGTPPERPDQ